MFHNILLNIWDYDRRLSWYFPFHFRPNYAGVWPPVRTTTTGGFVVDLEYVFEEEAPFFFEKKPGTITMFFLVAVNGAAFNHGPNCC